MAIRYSMTTVCVCMQVATLCHPFVVPLVESWVDRGHTINMVSGYCKSGDLGAVVHNPRVTSAVSSVHKVAHAGSKEHVTLRAVPISSAARAVALCRHASTTCRLQCSMRSANFIPHTKMFALPA